MSIIEKLTEGIVNRDMKAEGHALLNKWEATGLLEGLDTQHDKATMSRLLENQAKELLREASTMEAGNVEGFASVAFPIVRRVFAGLIANDLVSVQPMSLPSGLIFFLDFTFSDDVTADRLGQDGGDDSIYGQGVVGSEIIDGVSLSSANLDKQPYGFSSAYASPTGSIAAGKTFNAVTVDLDGNTLADNPAGDASVGDLVAADSAIGSMIGWDADLMDEHSGSYLLIASVDIGATDFNEDHLSQIILPLSGADSGATATQVRRLTREDPNNADNVLFTFLILTFAPCFAEIKIGFLPTCPLGRS